MSDSPEITIEVRDTVTATKLQNKLLDIIGDPDVKIGVNKIIAERAEKYIPSKSGALRASVNIEPDTISWGQGLEYAHYQYIGEVYGPNFPIVEGGSLRGFFRYGDRRYPILSGGTITGWFSLPGLTKQPTGRKLGTDGEWRGWTFGYTTSGTTDHWIDEMLSNEKRSMQVQITNYLKREAKKRNT